MFTSRSLWLLLIAACAWVLSPSVIGQPVISHATSQSGSALLRLTGTVGGCATFENRIAAVALNSISIVSLVRPLGSCAGFPHTLFIDFTVDVGFLPPGRYAVTWSFAYPNFPVEPLALAHIDVPPDGLALAIPALHPIALLAAILTMVISGACAARNQKRDSAQRQC